jgi:hypothetical protein
MEVLTLNPIPHGRIFVVGDVAGHFADLGRFVNDQGLDPRVDRLVLNGNFLGFSPSSRQALSWIEKPWVIPLLGRHEACILQALSGLDAPTLAGQWTDFLASEDKLKWVDRLQALPVALELQTEDLHAVVSHCPLTHLRGWTEVRESIAAWPGTADKVFSLFDGRLLGLGATGKLVTPFTYEAPGEPLSLSSFHMERPSSALLRKGRYAFLAGSSHMRHGELYSHPCLLPYVDLMSLGATRSSAEVCQGSVRIDGGRPAKPLGLSDI